MAEAEANGIHFDPKFLTDVTAFSDSDVSIVKEESTSNSGSSNEACEVTDKDFKNITNKRKAKSNASARRREIDAEWHTTNRKHLQNNEAEGLNLSIKAQKSSEKKVSRVLNTVTENFFYM